MQLSEIRTAARRQVLLSTDDLSDASLNTIINEGLRMVAASEKWPFLLTSVNFSTVANQREYAIATGQEISIANFMFMHSILDADKRDGRLENISFDRYLQQYGGDPPKGTPRMYYVRMGAIHEVGLVPVPTTNETNSHTMYYYKTPTELSADGDAPEWDPRFHHILMDYARFRMWEREEYFDESMRALEMFAGGLSEMRRFYNRAITDRGTVIFGDGINRNNAFNDRTRLGIL